MTSISSAPQKTKQRNPGHAQTANEHDWKRQLYMYEIACFGGIQNKMAIFNMNTENNCISDYCIEKPDEDAS